METSQPKQMIVPDEYKDDPEMYFAIQASLGIDVSNAYNTSTTE
jgi:hypothetical protein